MQTMNQDDIWKQIIQFVEKERWVKEGKLI